MSARDLKVSHAKELLKRVGGTGCVVIMFDGGAFSVAEYGKDRTECAKLKTLVEAIADRLESGDLPAP